MNRTKAATFTVLTALLAASFLTLSASAATTETFTVTASTMQYTFDLPQGTIFNGSLSTTGTVRVWVSDANGSLAANLGLVDSSAKFGFVANNAGKYYVNFENNLGNSVQVTFTYQTDPELPGGGSLIPFSYWPVFAAITVVGAVLIVYFIRKNRKRNAN